MNESNKLITPKYKQFLGTILVLLSALGFGTSGTIQAIAPVGATPLRHRCRKSYRRGYPSPDLVHRQKALSKRFFFNSV